MVNSELVHFVNAHQRLLKDELEGGLKDYLRKHCTRDG